MSRSYEKGWAVGRQPMEKKKNHMTDCRGGGEKGNPYRGNIARSYDFRKSCRVSDRFTVGCERPNIEWQKKKIIRAHGAHSRDLLEPASQKEGNGKG